MRPVRALALAAALGLLLVAIGAGVAWWLLTHGVAHAPLHNQPMNVRMPDNLPVQVDILDARAIGNPQDEGGGGLPVRLNETLDLDIEVDTEVPLELTVHYRGSIPVQAEVPVDTRIDTRVLGMPMELPIEGTIPLDFDLPVDLTIPIRQPVRLQFTAPITARVDQQVRIPLRGTMDARIRFGDAPIPLQVRNSELALPLDKLWLSDGGDGWRLGPLAPGTPRSSD